MSQAQRSSLDVTAKPAHIGVGQHRALDSAEYRKTIACLDRAGMTYAEIGCPARGPAIAMTGVPLPRDPGLYYKAVGFQAPCHMALSRPATMPVVSRDATSPCLKLVSFLRQCPFGNDLTGATEIIYARRVVFPCSVT